MLNFTVGARNFLAQAGHGLEMDDIQTFVRDALERPSDAAFWDKDLFTTHGLFFHTPDWSITEDDILGQANYRAALDLLARYGAQEATVGHWTYSRFQCIKVQILSVHGEVTRAALELLEILNGLEDYPVVDEEKWSELENNAQEKNFREEIDYQIKWLGVELSVGEREALVARVEELYHETDEYQNYGLYEGHDEDTLCSIIDSVLPSAGQRDSVESE